MSLQCFAYPHLYFKMPKALLSMLLALFLMCQFMPLEAGGWGKTSKVVEHEETTWNGVYFDMNGLNFIASIPNYAGTSMQNGRVTLKGRIEEEIAYLIMTSFNPGFTPPKKATDFAQMVQEANPSYVVNLVDANKLGAQYAVDLIPLDQEEDPIFWRFVSTNDRLIQMANNDTNENRRLYFFDSLYIDNSSP